MPEVNEALQSVPWHQLSNAVDRLLDGAVPQLRGPARIRLIGNYLAEMRRRTRAGAFNKKPARESDADRRGAELRGAELKAARARPYPPGYGLHTHVATVCTLACTQEVHRGGGPAPGMSGAGADDRGGAAGAGDFGAEETTAVTAGAFVEVGSPIGELTVLEAGPMPTHSWERPATRAEYHIDKALRLDPVARPVEVEAYERGAERFARPPLLAEEPADEQIARATREHFEIARAGVELINARVGSRYHFEQAEPEAGKPAGDLGDFVERVMAAVAAPSLEASTAGAEVTIYEDGKPHRSYPEPAAAAPPLYAHGPSSVAKYHEWTEAGGKSAPNCKTCGGPCLLWNGGGQP